MGLATHSTIWVGAIDKVLEATAQAKAVARCVLTRDSNSRRHRPSCVLYEPGGLTLRSGGTRRAQQQQPGEAAVSTGRHHPHDRSTGSH